MKQGFERIGHDISEQQARTQCLDKKRFKSRNAARDSAARMANNHPDWDAQHPYRCNICGKFHLSRTRPIDYRKVIESQARRQGKPLPKIETRPSAAQNQPAYPQEIMMKKSKGKKPPKRC